MTRMAAGTIDVDGGSLWYEIAGGGPDVVFLHPGLWDSRTWDDQFGEFSRMYRAIRYDARGYGRSSRIEPGRSYSHARDLKTLLDALDVSQAALDLSDDTYEVINIQPAARRTCDDRDAARAQAERLHDLPRDANFFLRFSRERDPNRVADALMEQNTEPD